MMIKQSFIEKCCVLLEFKIKGNFIYNFNNKIIEDIFNSS